MPGTQRLEQLRTKLISILLSHLSLIIILTADFDVPHWTYFFYFFFLEGCAYTPSPEQIHWRIKHRKFLHEGVKAKSDTESYQQASMLIHNPFLAKKSANIFNSLKMWITLQIRNWSLSSRISQNIIYTRFISLLFLFFLIQGEWTLNLRGI